MKYKSSGALTMNSGVCSNWTPSAIDCYNIGCQCDKCGLYHLIFKNSESECKMKHVVIELVRKLGRPEINKKG